MASITVKSIEEAWAKANELFPTDYEYDVADSARAGYPIYNSTSSDYRFAHISDLNDRLEVNFENGDAINIWIEEDEVEETEETKAEETKTEERSIEEMLADRKALEQFGAEQATELFEDAYSYRKLTFSVGGYSFESDLSKRAYKALSDKMMGTVHASDMVAEYCNAHGIKWGTIEDVKITHYGKDDEGHYIVEAFVGLRG